MNPFRRSITFAFVSALVTLGASAGCDPLDTSTAGEEGRLEFSWATQCVLECSLDHPVAVGSVEHISFDSGENYVVASSDDEVATFALERIDCSCERTDGNDSDAYGPVDIDGACKEGYAKSCDTVVEVRAHREGDVKLVVSEKDGTLVDKVNVEVRAPHSAVFLQFDGEEWSDTNGLQTVVGPEKSIIARFRDQSGRPLLSSKGVVWSSDDPLVADVVADPPLLNTRIGNNASVTPRSKGQTTLRAALPDFEAALPIVVSE